MANLVPDSIRGLLSQYTFQIDHKTNNDDLLCVVCKKLMIDAYQSYCGCQYCHDCIVKYLSERDKYCCGGKRQCNDELLVLESNVGRSILLNRKISRVRVNCPNKSCTHNAELIEMEQHLRVCTKQSIECPYVSLGCDNERADKDKILTHLHNDPLAHTELLIEYIHGLKNEVEQLKGAYKMNESEIKTLREDLKMKERKMEVQSVDIKGLKEEFNKNEITENEGRMRVDGSMATIGRLNINAVERIGGVTFRMDRFSARMTATQCIFSSYFYSHTNGYKLRLRMYPGGEYNGRNTHLSVSIQICKGEYDDQLSWPCKHTSTVSVVNQRSKETHETMVFCHFTAADNRQYCYNKPTNNDNDAHGCATFMSHKDMLSIVGVIVDDCVLVKCVVTDPM